MTERHGSPHFYALLEEMAELHSRKSHDYASQDDPFGNYLFSGRLAQMFAHSHVDVGFVSRLAEKLFRLANLEGSKKTPQNEAIADTERDIAVIVTLWMAARRQQRGENPYLPSDYRATLEDLLRPATPDELKAELRAHDLEASGALDPEPKKDDDIPF
jgi:hypothetical protein